MELINTTRMTGFLPADFDERYSQAAPEDARPWN